MFRKNPPPLQETVVKSIRKLKIQHHKLEQVSFRLEGRDKALFQTCISALRTKNRDRAAMCANEIAEVRKLIRFLYHVELAIERVILRLETIKELSGIIIDLKPALRLLQGVSKELFQFLPDVSSELSKVNDAVSETLYSTRMTTDETIIPVNRKTPGGEEILKEVSSFLEERIIKKLPEPPTVLETPELEPAPIKQMVALATACSQTVGRQTIEENVGNSSQNLFSYKDAEIQEVTLKVEKSFIEDALLEYAKKSKGEIDLTQCSLELETPYEEIEKALESLGAKGKIKIENRAR